MAENEKLEAKAAEKKPEKKKAKGPSVWARIAAWFRSVKAEMKKIVWESPKAVLYNTVMVLVALVDRYKVNVNIIQHTCCNQHSL